MDLGPQKGNLNQLKEDVYAYPLKLEPVKRRCICLPLVHTEENVCLFPSCQSSPDISVCVLELCPHESCA